MYKEALLFETIGERVRCSICEHHCIIRNNRRGVCGNYKNINGKLYHIGYGKLSAVEVRPIEIKPFFHYWPNSLALTFSGWGCNFHCLWCQNHHLSFRIPFEDDEYFHPENLVNLAVSSRVEGLCASFNEPTVNFEYLLDVFSLGKNYGLYSTVVTNGFQTLKAIEKLIEVGCDGWSIDIKGCPEVKGKAGILGIIDHEIIFRNAKYVLDLGGHVEMVYLIVTGFNDQCVEWIIDKHLEYLGPKTPLHINRYYPAFKWNKPATSLSLLLEARERAIKEGIEFVYVGNIHTTSYENTYCPNCGKLLIKRERYRITYFNLDKNGKGYRCPRCGYEIPIAGEYKPGRGLKNFFNIFL